MLDVIIIGGGPAGLSAALILGRCLRKVLLIDSGHPRNAYSQALHGYLTRDGIAPAQFIKNAKLDLKRYETVDLLDGEVISARKLDVGFEVTLNQGQTFQGKKLLLATGVIDYVPHLDGVEEIYGKSVHTCPYCDAWEYKGKQIAVYGKGKRGFNLSQTMKTWSDHIILFTNGASHLSDEEKTTLQRNGIRLHEGKIKYLKSELGKLKNISMQSGEIIPRDAFFFNTESYLRSGLLKDLHLHYDEESGVPFEKYSMTELPGAYVAGNICKDVQLVIVAAAEGARAAFGINSALSLENRLYIKLNF